MTLPSAASPGPRRLRIAIIGAGMSGILCGVRLPQEGYVDFTIYEKAASLGGTWRDNRYPGLACDVPSHLYSYSFAPNPGWSHKFSPGPEINSYLEQVAARFDVMPRIRFGTEITACDYRDGRWHLSTAAGEIDRADIVIAATGVLHNPVLPKIEGLDSFAGPAFHTARWDDSVSLAGRRVGIIGTGSTAIQIVSAVIDEVARLSLFQRTAQWIFPQPNPAYSEEDKARFAAAPEMLHHIRQRMSEGFSENFSNAVVDATSEQMKAIEALCRQNLEENVRDPELKAKLTPDYRAACKRLIMADGFYDAIQRPNAGLITEAIDRIVAEGVRTRDGRLYELDVLVLATGFNPHQFMRPMQVTGRDGVDLDRAWAQSVHAYRSVSLPGFPNFFMMIGPQSPIGNFSLIEIAEMQLDYILQLIDLVRAGRCDEVSPTAAATTAFNQTLVDAMSNTIWVTGCRSWYLDQNGVPATWPWTLQRFQEDMRAPKLSDFELTTQRTAGHG